MNETHTVVDAANGNFLELEIEGDLHGLTVRLPSGRMIILDIESNMLQVRYQPGESSDGTTLGHIRV